MKPATRAACKLIHDGTLVFSKMERRGVRIDVAKLDSNIANVKSMIKEQQDQLYDSKVWRRWCKAYASPNLNSPDQLATVLFDKMGLKAEGITGSGKRSVSEASLQKIKHPFVKSLLKKKKLEKALSTFLYGIRNELNGDRVHPFFNMHTTKTYRSSSSEPNWHNLPRRDEFVSKMVRECVIPEDGNVLIENDFGALEFRVAACFWEDPKMLAYARDKSKDIHRDMGAKCYLCKPEEVTKEIRDRGKNSFVFPRLYGSWWPKIARHIWKESKNIQFNGESIYEWFARKGITEVGESEGKEDPLPGTLEKHIYRVQKWFDSEFSVYADSREEWISNYRKRGWFRLMTGFIVQGVYSHNMLLNYPIQGPGFHCLLWTLIELEKEIRKNKMKALLIGQIHDCALGDVPEREKSEYVGIVKDIVANRLPKHFDWIKVPMEIEAEITPVNGSWFDKKKVDI